MKILLATDGSEHSTLALHAAVDLSAKAGSELHVVNAWRALPPYAHPSVAVALWALASLAFAFLLPLLPDYGAIYGSLGAAISLLLYLYVSAAAVLLGAEVNAAMVREPPGTAKAACSSHKPISEDRAARLVDRDAP